MPSTEQSQPEAQAIHEALDRILRSRLFVHAGRVRWVLRRIVDLSLAGRAGEISEKTLAADMSGDALVLEGDRTSVVRTTMLRLRTRLDTYYCLEGRDEEVRIEVPKGSYEPRFSWRGRTAQTRFVTHPLLPRLSENVEARRLYLEGALYLERQAGPELRRALGFFERAFQADPRFAAALAGMADCHYLLAVMGLISGADALREAAPLLDRAVRTDSECGSAWASMGVIQGVLGWRWKRAEECFRRAIQLGPDMPGTLLKYASFNLLVRRRFDEAGSMIQAALERQPNAPRINLHYIIAACCRGDYAVALEHGRRTLELAPRLEPLHMWLGRTYCALGSYDQALAHFHTAAGSNYSRYLVGYEGYCHARLGHTARAMRVLDRLLNWRAPEGVPDHIFATLYLGLGEMDKCLDSLAAAVDSRCPWAPLLLSADPLFAEVRREPRAMTLMRKMKLPVHEF